MKKLIAIFLILLSIGYAATPEQVERYLMLSHAEEDLLQLEASFSNMQNKIAAKDGKEERYDTQLLSIRFREHLQKTLSENEMEKVLENYKNEVLLKFVYESSDPEGDYLEIAKYVKEVQNDPEKESRLEIVKKINKYYSNEDAIVQMFDTLVVPIMKKMKPDEIDDKKLKKMRENYIKSMSQNGYNQVLYATRDFSIEELDELLEIAKTPALGYEIKAVYGAMAYAMEEFMEKMADRMGHRPKRQDSNKTNK